MSTRTRRWPTSRQAFVCIGEQKAPAEILDVSDGGMKLLCRYLDAKPGSTIAIEAARTRFTVEIRWRAGRRFGVMFRPSLPADLLFELSSGNYRVDSHTGFRPPATL